MNIEFPIWTAIVTPMNVDGSIDYKSFELLLQKQEEAKNGVLVLGSTGEGLNLTDQEKREIVKFVKLQDLSVPIMAGLGGHALETQKSFITYCDEVGVDAFLLVAPIYAKPAKEGQLAWFKALMSTTNTPCMVYNVPSRTGIHIHPEVPAKLFKEYSHYMGLKEASGSMEKFKAFRDASPKAHVYCGDDNLIKEFSEEGGVGLVSVAANVWPKETHKYSQICLNSDNENGFNNWVESVDLFFHAPSPIPVKTLLQHKGWISSNTVRLPLSLKDLQPKTKDALIEADKEINNWIKEV